ncbi:membrane protein [Gordonia phage Commandaria]|uniref:Membrane protein n=1 Tax=Gordonia phage Commandaria TaxID=3038364 RepID=A0AAF0K7E5_9CAUD|nr:membrane protein [Gordonia phage Commandaria]WGH20801.1 membrane protein [Gordonia phage Commandaria]
MSTREKIGTGAALWVVFAAMVNATENHWLASFTCLMIAAAILSWVFGRALERRERRARREQRDLLERLNHDMASERTIEYVQDERGFYVPRREDRGDRRAVGRDDQECDQR